MDVKVRVLQAWPNDQLCPDLADLWPNESVGIAMAILDFMSMGIYKKMDWHWYIWEQVACILWRTAAEVTVQNLELVAMLGFYVCLP